MAKRKRLAAKEKPHGQKKKTGSKKKTSRPKEKDSWQNFFDTETYLPTLPVFPGVSKFFMKSPGLPVRAPNLPGTTYRGSFTFLIH